MFLVNLIDTHTGTKATFPHEADWNAAVEEGFKTGDWSDHKARHYMFLVGQGYSTTQALLSASKNSWPGRYVVESVQVKGGKVVYSEKVTS